MNENISLGQMLEAAFHKGYNACYRSHNLGTPENKKEVNLREIVSEVFNEVNRATRLHAPMNSPHEAESVIREEFEEFWDEVKAYNLPKGRDTRPAMREELVQLAAMAVRAISDVIDKPEVTVKTLIMAPLPAGVQDTPEVRARLQAYRGGTRWTL
jgi:hypothetical protein